MRKLLASLVVPAAIALGAGTAGAAPGNIGAPTSGAFENAGTSGDVTQVHWRHGHRWHRYHYGYYRPYSYHYPRYYYPRRYYNHHYQPYYYRPYYHRRSRFNLHIGF